MSSDRRLPRLTVAIGILFFRTILCSAIFLASRSWHVLRLLSLFFTFDNLSRLEEEHEDERDTWCMVFELKESAASDGSSHSSLHSSLSSSSSSTQGKCSGLRSISHPSISLFTHHLFCVFCVRSWPPMSTCTTSVCAPLQMVSKLRT